MAPLLIQGSPVYNLADGCFYLSENPLTRVPPVTWHAEITGRMLRVYRENVRMKKPPNVKRRAVGVWSIQSRMRLLVVLNTIDYDRLGPSVFVTLTYPDVVRRDSYKKRSLDRQRMLRDLERAVGKRFAAFWRIEWEERKSGAYTGKLAPHFHLCLFNVAFVNQEKVRELWRKVIGYQSGPLVTDVRRIYNVDGVGRYLGKYLAKYRSLDFITYHNSSIEFGRHWGLTRKTLVPFLPTRLQRQLSEFEKETLVRFAKATSKRYGEYGETGFKRFGKEVAERVEKFLRSS